MYLVSAWATDQGIALGQLAVEEKSNEITAIPQLLDQLDLTDAVVTIDAAGCQRNIADEIVAGGGDYVLALKGNQETLHRDVTDLFAKLLEEDFGDTPVSRHEEREHSHGRTEERDYYQISVPTDFPQREKWTGLKTFGLAIRRSIVRRQRDDRPSLLHQQSIASRAAFCGLCAWSLEHREQSALGVGHDVSRRRESGARALLGRQSRLASPLGVDPIEATSRQRQYRHEASPSRLERRFPDASPYEKQLSVRWPWPGLRAPPVGVVAERLPYAAPTFTTDNRMGRQSCSFPRNY